MHTKQPVGHSLEELYRAVEDMCVHNLAASIYDRLRGECELHIESRLEKLLGQTPDTLAFLSLVHSCWADHCEQMLTLRSIFLYLDRTYVMQVSASLFNAVPIPQPMSLLWGMTRDGVHVHPPYYVHDLSLWHSLFFCLLWRPALATAFIHRWPPKSHFGTWDCKSSAPTSAAARRSYANRSRGCWR